MMDSLKSTVLRLKVQWMIWGQTNKRDDISRAEETYDIVYSVNPTRRYIICTAMVEDGDVEEKIYTMDCNGEGRDYML